MKKLFAFIFTTLCIPLCNLYADTVTSGDIGLVLPSTGIVDRSRGYGDKINSNFQAIVSTITDMRTSITALGVATGTLALTTTVNTRFNNVFYILIVCCFCYCVPMGVRFCVALLVFL